MHDDPMTCPYCDYKSSPGTMPFHVIDCEKNPANMKKEEPKEKPKEKSVKRKKK